MFVYNLPFKRDCHYHENRAGHRPVLARVEEIGKQHDMQVSSCVEADPETKK